MSNIREDIRQAYLRWLNNGGAGINDDLRSFEAGVLYSEATLSTREKNVEAVLKENERLKADKEFLNSELMKLTDSGYTMVTNDDAKRRSELSDALRFKVGELEECKSENLRLREALEKAEALSKWYPTNGEYQSHTDEQILVWDEGDEKVKTKIFTGGWATYFTFWKPFNAPTEASKTNSDEKA